MLKKKKNHEKHASSVLIVVEWLVVRSLYSLLCLIALAWLLGCWLVWLICNRVA